MDDSLRHASKDRGDAPKDTGDTPPDAGDSLSDAEDPLSVRADELLARAPEGPVPLTAERHDGVRGPELDVLIGELRSVADELRKAPALERPLALVEARLGALTATRYVLDGRPEDRVRAKELLEAARVSQVLGEDARLKAHANLLALLMARLVGVHAQYPELREDGPGGLRLDDLRKAVEVGLPAEYGGSGLPEDTYRLFELLREQAPADMPRELLEKAEIFASALEAVRRNDIRGFVAAGQRVLDTGQGPTSLLTHVLNSLVPTAVSLFGDAAFAEAEAGATAGVGTGTGSAPRADGPFDPMSHLAEIAALADVRDPGTLDSGELPRLVEALVSPGADGEAPELSSRMIAAMAHFSLAMRTGNMTSLTEALRLMHEAFTADEFDSQQLTGWLLPVSAGLLTMAAMMGGSLEDQEMAGAILREMDRFAPEDDRPDVSAMRLLGRVIRLRKELDDALGDADPDGVEDVIAELQELEDELDEGSSGYEDWMRLGPSFLAASAYLGLALLTRSVEDVRMAAHRLEHVLGQDVNVPVMRTLMDTTWAPLLSLVALVERDPGRLAEGIERTRSVLGRPGVSFDFVMRVRTALAIALQVMYELTGESAHLHEAVRELQAAREELPPGAPGNSSVHALLAESLALRAVAPAPAPEPDGARAPDGVRAPDGAQAPADDLRAAVSAARDSLRASADTVLLQANTRHALQVAREAADQGRKAALWALRAGDPEEAVGALEAGRSLVLQAAAESAGVADRLEALGAGELAGRWRAATAEPPARVATGTSWSPIEELLLGSPEGGPELPSEVRRESLALLRDRNRTVDEPAAETVAALRTGLARCDADALVLLLPGDDAEDGALLLVTPEGQAPVRAVASPELSGRGRAPVAAFLKAGAHRQKLETTDAEVSHQEHDRAQRAWTTALEALCDWAGGVLGPVFGELGLWERALSEGGFTGQPDAEPRQEGTDDGGGTAVRLVLVPCGELGVVPWQAAVLRPPAGHGEAGAPGTVRACEVAVLTHAASGREFLRAASRHRMRPAERPVLVYHGHDLDWAEDEVTDLMAEFYPDGTLYTAENGTTPTPDTVLALLRRSGDGAASLVHLACHGSAGTDPTTSALQLAPTPEQSAAGAYEADLALSAILDTPPGRQRAVTRGPLVVCSACETDLTTRDHDEALTVTSVLVHRLATDAVGSRWKVLDGTSHILMLVLHDRLAAGLAPPDALRAAQRWMITAPGRRPRVPALDGLSEYRLREDFRDRPEAWAAFVHQGNPAPAARQRNGEEGVPA
ncbi:CHAT domain-containing protein [Streptomyces sp. NPDC007264]|uniref:CHAT domain-containing protein n=1 Tax=Streptomyces sp. NPDC007264 TaxID=3364777 RepID=UPI0036D80186